MQAYIVCSRALNRPANQTTLNTVLHIDTQQIITHRVNHFASYNLSTLGENSLDKLFGATAI